MARRDRSPSDSPEGCAMSSPMNGSSTSINTSVPNGCPAPTRTNTQSRVCLVGGDVSRYIANSSRAPRERASATMSTTAIDYKTIIAFAKTNGSFDNLPKEFTHLLKASKPVEFSGLGIPKKDQESVWTTVLALCLLRSY